MTRMEDWRMTEERLADIEEYSGKVRIGPDFDVSVSQLVAEVRRLRRENHLLSLSRCMPSIVGGD